MTYPYPCCQCGFCCLHESCPAAMALFGIGKHDPCPALTFEGDKAVCTIVRDRPETAKEMGVGSGCCIKATAYAGGQPYDFAALPAHIKKALAERMR